MIDRESNMMDQWIRKVMHVRKGYEQVDEARRWVLLTSRHLWLLTGGQWIQSASQSS